jgi:hypothetical protein
MTVYSHIDAAAAAAIGTRLTRVESLLLSLVLPLPIENVNLVSHGLVLLDPYSWFTDYQPESPFQLLKVAPSFPYSNRKAEGSSGAASCRGRIRHC